MNGGLGSTTNTVRNDSPFIDANAVKVVNSFDDDFLVGRLNGRGTGFTGGYTSSIGQTPQAVMPTYSGWNGFMPLPDPAVGTGSSDVKLASSSTQDAVGGTGIYFYIVFYLNLIYELRSEIIPLSGTTPVTLIAKFIYHFQFAFPVSRGSTFPSLGLGTMSSNIGTVWLGIGTTFSGTTGFNTANYMWNRPNDGFLSSSIYVVPANRLGTLWTVKFNSDTTVASSFKTYNRSSRGLPWTLNAEDTVNTTIAIQRSLSGGFMPAGAEFTVFANKTTGASNISANFVLTCYEISSKSYSQGSIDII